MFGRMSLFVDFYELTMVSGYVRHGMDAKAAVFDLYFRANPFQGGYALFAGLEPALDYLAGLAFEAEDLDYLRSLQLFPSDFLDYLRDFRFRGRVTATSEGEVVFANEPLLTVEAGLAEAQLVETALLNIVNFQTLVATKAVRIAGEAGEASVMEFGARRAQGPDGALSAARAACIGGVGTTSNVMAGRAFGIPLAGTQAHSWIMAFPSEIDAFRAYAAAFPDHCVLLVDTYDTLRSGIPNAITVGRELAARGHRLRGVRLDSGDLAYLSREARRLLDAAGLHEVKIVASNELDEHVIESIRKEGGRIDLYGAGTRLATAAGPGGGALGGIYKLVELDAVPRLKVSADGYKSTLPGRKRLWRASQDAAPGRFELDVLSLADETPHPGDPVFDPTNPMRHTTIPAGSRLQDLRHVVMDDGRRSRPGPPLAHVAEYAREQLGRLPEGVRRLLNAHVYRLAQTQGLRALRERMIEAAAAAAGRSHSAPGGGS